MAKITITKDNLLSLDEFKTLLEQTETLSSTMDYIMATDAFYAR